MKTKITFALFALAFSLTAFSQSYYNGFNYQAAIRDGNGDIMANESVNIRFSIRQKPEPFNIRYQEVHTTTTSEFGLVNLVIGAGTVTQFTWANVFWGVFDYQLQVEVDTGNGYVNLGSSDFRSVPFALRSQLATDMEMIDLVDVEWVNNQPPSDGQALIFNADEGWFENRNLNIAQSLFFLQSGPNLTLSDGINDDTINLGQWSRSGNSGTNSTNFIGTTDAMAFRIKTNDAERMRITDIGRVGIGTTTPGQLLHVNSASVSAYQMFSNSTTGSVAYSDGLLIGSGNNYGYVFNYEDSDLLFGTNGTTRMSIKNDGKVGIGTATPEQIFHVQDNNWQVHIENTSGNQWNIGASGSSWEIGNGKFAINNGTSSSSSKLVIDASGNVGIGVTDPTEFLDVAGTARLRNMDQSDLDPNCNFGLRTVHADCTGNLVVGDEWEDGSTEERGYYYSVPGSAFQPANPNVDYNINLLGEMELLEGDYYNFVVAPVNLPHNAYILEVKAYVHDGFSAGNLTISLVQYDVVTGSSTADATTSGSGGDQVLEIDPGYSETVDNTSEAVSLMGYISQSADPNFAGEVSISAVMIRYKLQ